MPYLADVATRLDHWRACRHDTYRPIGLEHSEAHLAEIFDTVLADSHLDLRTLEALLAQPWFEELTILHEDGGHAFEKAPPRLAMGPEDSNETIHGEENCSRDQPTLDREVWTCHGVLHRVRDQQDDDQIEDCHLSQLSLPCHAKADKHTHIDERRPTDDHDGACSHLEHANLH
jgi:hypothetical protein